MRRRLLIAATLAAIGTGAVIASRQKPATPPPPQTFQCVEGKPCKSPTGEEAAPF